MELKHPTVMIPSDPGVCSNRTFMELKLIRYRSQYPGTGCSNRTFMELKLNKFVFFLKSSQF